MEQWLRFAFSWAFIPLLMLEYSFMNVWWVGLVHILSRRKRENPGIEILRKTSIFGDWRFLNEYRSMRETIDIKNISNSWINFWWFFACKAFRSRRGVVHIRILARVWNDNSKANCLVLVCVCHCFHTNELSIEICLFHQTFSTLHNLVSNISFNLFKFNIYIFYFSIPRRFISAPIVIIISTFVVPKWMREKITNAVELLIAAHAHVVFFVSFDNNLKYFMEKIR